MENSKTLSSQWYTEDHDLLKWSMRKSKHGDGNPESDSDEEQAALDLEASKTATTAMSPKLPNDLVANQLPDPSPSPPGEELGVKAPRSYLDTQILMRRQKSRVMVRPKVLVDIEDCLLRSRVAKMMKLKGMKVKAGVSIHRNTYFLITNPNAPKIKAGTPTKKNSAIAASSSSNVPLIIVFKKV
nr:uncharacterized protein LOC109167327 [Ipomoea batatas]